MKEHLEKLIILLNILTITNFALGLNPYVKSIRTWESVCSILSCQSVLDKCIRNNCMGLNQCRNCVQIENQNCLRCVDSILNEQYFSINGTQTIICDSKNMLHETTCNFYCRIKEINLWKCEQIGGYPLCNCNGNNFISTTTFTSTTTTATTTSTTTKIQPIGSLLCNKNST